jgi:hypothetical protein
MARAKFLDGVHKYIINGETEYAEYMGRQKGFECCVCRKGCNAYTFNILHGKTAEEAIRNYENGDYETVGFGEDHLNHVTLKAIVL